MLIHSKLTQWIEPDWPAPATVQSVVSTRHGTLSRSPQNGFNTADHVSAQAEDVQVCRRYFQQRFNLTKTPQWLNQVHGIEVIHAAAMGDLKTADACYTQKADVICTVHTADCLPVFFCNQQGTEVAIAHAGWRGLLNGVLENTLQAFQSSVYDVLIWLGPAISQAYFEVGPEVKHQFEAAQIIPEGAFALSGKESESGLHYRCDLYALAAQRLRSAGCSQIYGGQYCTYSDPRFFSYRRQSNTGRLLSAIWIQASA